MEPIRVVRGTGRGPTKLSAYDAALADAGICDYNLVRLSSVIPAGVDLRVSERAGDLGPIGERLTVVEASATASGRVAATLAWARRADGSGIFYEAGATGLDAADRSETEATTGREAGVDLREWTVTERDAVTATVTTADGASETSASAVVVAIYGSSEAVL